MSNFDHVRTMNDMVNNPMTSVSGAVGMGEDEQRNGRAFAGSAEASDMESARTTTFGSVREAIGDTWDALAEAIGLLETLTGRLLGMNLDTPQHLREVPLRNMAICCAEKAEFTRAALQALLQEIEG